MLPNIILCSSFTGSVAKSPLHREQEQLLSHTSHTNYDFLMLAVTHAHGKVADLLFRQFHWLCNAKRTISEKTQRTPSNSFPPISLNKRMILPATRSSGLIAPQTLQHKKGRHMVRAMMSALCLILRSVRMLRIARRYSVVGQLCSPPASHGFASSVQRYAPHFVHFSVCLPAAQAL